MVKPLALLLVPCLMAHAAAPLELESDKGMVVTSQHLASEVGAAILRRGGNAVDAAVAVGYALAVTHPCCGNLGGGAFMTIHFADGKSTFINFRERAPLAARADMFLDAQGKVVGNRSLNGYLAVGVQALTAMGYKIVPLESWGSGNAVEAIGIAPADAAAAKALGFPRPALFYGANDSRAPAGSAAAP
jgi:gamma-glutamyltranspeptidase/glutathione hydrolase